MVESTQVDVYNSAKIQKLELLKAEEVIQRQEKEKIELQIAAISNQQP